MLDKLFCTTIIPHFIFVCNRFSHKTKSINKIFKKVYLGETKDLYAQKQRDLLLRQLLFMKSYPKQITLLLICELSTIVICVKVIENHIERFRLFAVRSQILQ